MIIHSNIFDIWTFYIGPDGPRFLLLHTSQEKADKWYHGGCFWQPPSAAVVEDTGEFSLPELMAGTLQLYGQEAVRFFSADYTYTQYSSRRQGLELISVFGGTIQSPLAVPLTWQHDEYAWLSADECMEKLSFRGHKEGLRALVENVVVNFGERRELWL
jgi:hypothetical protein